MLDQVLEVFGIQPDADLNLMVTNQTLESLTANMLIKLGAVLTNFMPDYVMVHGDTTTTFVASLSAFYKKIPVIHVEAGLRTGFIDKPWPEEANRKLTSILTKMHFAPTKIAKQNLLSEGVASDAIVLTGNTVVDSLKYVSSRIDEEKALFQCLDDEYAALEAGKFVLITGHRRENFGDGMKNICQGIRNAAFKFPSMRFIYAVHLNPKVEEPVNEILGDIANVELVKPLDYVRFIYLMRKCYFIVTDSGGIQEEAMTFKKPMLVTRDVSERQEAVTAGAAILVGTDRQKLETAISNLILDVQFYQSMQAEENPFGDGFAALRIADHMERVCDQH
jgi:UDP-N-acetylglucosamine 2-epimerase (non-hydrolysing)